MTDFREKRKTLLSGDLSFYQEVTVGTKTVSFMNIEILRARSRSKILKSLSEKFWQLKAP